MATHGNPDCTDRYNMDHKRRGLAVIINNEKFKHLATRAWSDVDVKQLTEALEFLGFDVETHENQTAYQMLGIFKSVSERNHEDADCFVLAILSHGDEGKVYGTDGPISLSAVCHRFQSDSCPSLHGKPKIFLLQACQGLDQDRGVIIKGQQTGKLDTSATVTDSEVYHGDQEEFSHIPPVTTNVYVPKERDMLVVLSSPPGYVSHRRREQGSWFIKSLCQELRLCHDDTEIMDLLTRVNYHVAYEFESSANKVGRGNKQVPCIMSVLTKKMYIKKK